MIAFTLSKEGIFMLYLDEDVLAGSNSNEANSENTQYCTNDIATNRCNGYGYA